MSWQHFVQLLEERGVVSSQVVSQLREKLSASAEPVDIRAVAQSLTKRGLLTPEMSQSLVAETEQSQGFTRPELSPNSSGGTPTLLDHPDESEAEASPGVNPMDPPPPRRLRDKLESEVSRSSVRSQWGLDAPTEVPRLDANMTDVLLGPESAGGGRKPNIFDVDLDRLEAEDAPAEARRRWDSPLLLVGGAGLLLLVVAGIWMGWSLWRGSADALLVQAEEDYRAQSYSQSIAKLDRFVEGFDSHPRASHARVLRDLARLRLASESAGEPLAALELAREALPRMADEPSFSESRDELAGILPQIAARLATSASETAAGSPQSGSTERPETAVAKLRAELEQAREALALVDRYVLESLRPIAMLNQIQEDLAVADRRLASLLRLESAVTDLSAVDDAPRVWDEYLKATQEFPELAGHPLLTGMLREQVETLRELVRVTQADLDPETIAVPSPITATLIPANYQEAPIAVLRGQVVAFTWEGTAYGFDAESGHPLWRRYLGDFEGSSPLRIGEEGAADFVLIDAARQELLRVTGRTGEIRWRAKLPGPSLPPVSAQERLFVSTRRGEVLVFDAESGRRLRGYQLPQPVSVAPTVDYFGERILQLAEGGFLYVLDERQPGCAQVVYLGHAPSYIVVPPVLLPRHVVLAENHRSRESRLHVFPWDGKQLETASPQIVPLEGVVLNSPLVSGEELWATTDGEGMVWLRATAGQKQLATVFSQPATGEQMLTRFLAQRNQRLWQLSEQVTVSRLVSARGQIIPDRIVLSGAVVQAPLQVFQDVGIVARLVKDQPGLTISAFNLEAPYETYWETRCAVPPLAVSRLREQTGIGLLVGADGSHAMFTSPSGNMAALPVEAGPGEGERQWFDLSQLMPDGRVVAATSGAGKLWIVSPGAGRSQGKLQSLPGNVALATTPAAFGTGLLLPDRWGQIHYWDPRQGERRAAPFQPPQAAGQSRDWRPLGTQGATARPFIAGDSEGRFYLVSLRDKPTPHLQLDASLTHDTAMASPWAVGDASAFAVDSQNRMLKIRLPEFRLEILETLTAPWADGPFSLEQSILLVTNEQLICRNEQGAAAWSIPWPHGKLAGQPLSRAAEWILVSRQGRAFGLNPTDGSLNWQVDLGQPCAAGPVQIGDRLAVAAHDGALLFFTPGN